MSGTEVRQPMKRGLEEDAGPAEEGEEEGEEEFSRPQKRHFRTRAHSNVLNANDFWYPASPAEVPVSKYYPKLAAESVATSRSSSRVARRARTRRARAASGGHLVTCGCYPHVTNSDTLIPTHSDAPFARSPFARSPFAPTRAQVRPRHSRAARARSNASSDARARCPDAQPRR